MKNKCCQPIFIGDHKSIWDRYKNLCDDTLNKHGNLQWLPVIQSTDLCDTIICLKTVSELHHTAMIVFITNTNVTSEEWAKINSLKMIKK